MKTWLEKMNCSEFATKVFQLKKKIIFVASKKARKFDKDI